MANNLFFYSSVLALLFILHGLKVNLFPCKLDKDFVKSLASSRYESASRFPLEGKVAIVTGSTNGLGKTIAGMLHEMGGTVVIASRNAKKCAKVSEELEKLSPDSPGRLVSMEVDTSDFASVRTFTSNFKKKFSELHLLVNNAGINYNSWVPDPCDDLSIDLKSAQGFDLAFATNYLGHWLLVDLLLPHLKATPVSRVVQVSSAFHWNSPGREYLLPGYNTSSDVSMPLAASADVRDRIQRHLSYGNNKLAQVLHAKELQRQLDAASIQQPTIVSVCPGWVATDILPPGPVGRSISKLAYQQEAGVLSSLYAMFAANEVVRGNFVSNYLNVASLLPTSLCGSIFSFINEYGGTKVRSAIQLVFAMFTLLLQQWTYGVHVASSSPESYDVELGSKLYSWTERTLAA